MSKIWAKDNKEMSNTAKFFNSFTTGNDYIIDRDNFLYFDLVASKAHALTLQEAGIYSKEDLFKINNLLDMAMITPGLIEVTKEDEDCHTAIEKYLTKLAGDLGKKIHTGRSRNDQSLTMIRLYMTTKLGQVMDLDCNLIETLDNLSKRYKDQLFIGYSHTQQAMITTLGHYYNAFCEQVSDDWDLLENIKFLIDKSPLGSGAGFGSPVKLNRKLSAKKMGFRGVQNNSLYCQNSRGKFELLYVQGLGHVMETLQKLATDMILYTTREFSFFDVSDDLSQGSSMMPQKKNLDVFELIRAKAAEVISLEARLHLINKGLPSGYNRDLQLVKNAIVEATETTSDCLRAMDLALRNITPNDANIRKEIREDIYSADLATIKCMDNPALNFRDVYKDILNDKTIYTPEEILKRRVSAGSPGNY